MSYEDNLLEKYEDTLVQSVQVLLLKNIFFVWKLFFLQFLDMNGTFQFNSKNSYAFIEINSQFARKTEKILKCEGYKLR